MENKYNINSINDLKRDVLEKIIAEMPDQDKEELREYLSTRAGLNAAGIFTTVRGYVFNKYFRTTPVRDRKQATFAETLNGLLNITQGE